MKDQTNKEILGYLASIELKKAHQKVRLLGESK
jgi:hypothetical protein